MVNVALMARGAKMDYWDIVGHLYPADFVSNIRRRKEEEEEKARQLRSFESIMSMKVER